MTGFDKFSGTWPELRVDTFRSVHGKAKNNRTIRRGRIRISLRLTEDRDSRQPRSRYTNNDTRKERADFVDIREVEEWKRASVRVVRYRF